MLNFARVFIGFSNPTYNDWPGAIVYINIGASLKMIPRSCLDFCFIPQQKTHRNRSGSGFALAIDSFIYIYIYLYLILNIHMSIFIYIYISLYIFIRPTKSSRTNYPTVGKIHLQKPLFLPQMKSPGKYRWQQNAFGPQNLGLKP